MTRRAFYDYKLPIADPRAFFGRSAQLQRGRETIERRACVSFVGEPGSGLTSLLNRFGAEDFREECEASAGSLRFIHVDCSQFDEPLPLVRHFLAQVVSDQPAPRRPNWRSAYGLLVRAIGSLEGERVVLLFDDFELIGSDGDFVDFVDSLRGLTQNADMTLVTATHTELKNCCHMDIVASPFPNLFQVEYLGSLSSEEVAELVETTSACSGVDLVPYSNHILELGGGLPYFLQMACWHYYQVIVRGAEPDHEAIAADFGREARDAFGRIWERLTEDEREVLRSLSGSSSTGSFSESLARKGYVIEDRIFSSAFCSYVKETT